MGFTTNTTFVLLQLRQRKFWSIHIHILTNFKKIIFKQFRTFHPSPICTFCWSRKTCTWLREQFRTFHPSLHESVAQQIPFSAKSSTYRRQTHRFLSRTPLKTGVEPQNQPLWFSYKNQKNFTEKHLYWCLFLIELQVERLKHRCFPVEFPKSLKNYERLLLKPIISPRVYF